jgi:hypothetical protein
VVRTSILRAALACAALVLAVVGLSACGSSASSSSTSTRAAALPQSTAGRAKLVACLKQHGVTLPSRFRGPGAGGPPRTGRVPGAGAGGPGGLFNGGSGAGGRFRANPKLAQAFRACGGGAFRRFGDRAALRARRAAAIQSFVACVDRHGFKLPSPNLNGPGPVFSTRLQTNRRFLAAAKPCTALLRASGPPPGAPGAPAPAGPASSQGA